MAQIEEEIYNTGLEDGGIKIIPDDFKDLVRNWQRSEIMSKIQMR